MTILDPISGLQITVHPSGKPYGPVSRDAGCTGGKQLERAVRTLSAGERSKSAELSPEHLPRKSIKAWVIQKKWRTRRVEPSAPLRLRNSPVRTYSETTPESSA